MIILVLLLVLYNTNSMASKVISEKTENTALWMSSTMDELASGAIIDSCLYPPTLNGFEISSHQLNLSEKGKWLSTGIKVHKDKYLKFTITKTNIIKDQKKYKVLYKIDPRFKTPKIFIKEYNPTDKKYLYNKNLSTIKINKGDVINITIDNADNFFDENTQELETELSISPLINKNTNNFLDKTLGNTDFNTMTTRSVLNNQIIYTSAKTWCDNIIKQYTNIDDTDINSIIGHCPGNKTYVDSSGTWDIYVGNINNSRFNTIMLSLGSCIVPTNNINIDNLENITTSCFYDKGLGLSLTIGSEVIKPSIIPFLTTPLLNNGKEKHLFYYLSHLDGDLNFTTDWAIEGMYVLKDNITKKWNMQLYENWGIKNNITNTMYDNLNNIAMKFLHFGRYFMHIEIGNGLSSSNNDSQIEQEELIEYAILDSNEIYDINEDSNITSHRFTQSEFNAHKDGYIWIRIKPNNNDHSGLINFSIENYIGNRWVSDLVYNSILKPVSNAFKEQTKLLYSSLSSNPVFKNIAYALLTLYIIIYTLFFLSGAINISTSNLVVVIMKIILISILFTRQSWDFFNNNFFQMFISGSDYLINSILGATSSVGNIFGYIDPILDKYTNSRLWALIAIQLFQIHNGLAILSIMIITGILTYAKSILEVIISYSLTFVALSIIISLAPFFILLILFEKTRSIFDNWLSLLFHYTIKPTILLIFFLIIDELMTTQLLNALTKACWGILFKLWVTIDLSAIFIPISFKFPFPFLPYISFYVPDIVKVTEINHLFSGEATMMRIISSTLLFFAFCKVSQGLVGYTNIISQYLTNVAPDHKSKKGQGGGFSYSDSNKAMSIITSPLVSTRNFIKEKFIHQRIRRNQPSRLAPIVGKDQSFNLKNNKEISSQSNNIQNKPNLSNINKDNNIQNKSNLSNINKDNNVENRSNLSNINKDNNIQNKSNLFDHSKKNNTHTRSNLSDHSKKNNTHTRSNLSDSKNKNNDQEQ